MKVHGRECFKERAVNRVKGCYKSSYTGDSRFLGFRNEKVIDYVARSSVSDILGHVVRATLQWVEV